MQVDSRVERRRPLRSLTGEGESPRSNPQAYPTHFKCKMDPENKRKFKPWAIEKSFTQEIGSKPATIKSNNESEIVIEISNEKESKFLSTIKSLCFSKLKNSIATKSTNAKAYNYNIPDIDD